MSASELRSDWWRAPPIVDRLGPFLADHVLGLEVVAQLGDGPPRRELFSGCLFQFCDVLFWITASHCLEEIKKITTHKSVDRIFARWQDKCSIAGAKAIPLELRDMKNIGAGELGSDVGLAFFRPNEHELVRRSGIRPFTIDEASSVTKPKPDGYYILGYPAEARVDHVEEDAESYYVSFDAPLVCLASDLSLPPEYHDEPASFWGRESCLYGEVELVDERGEEVLRSIKGVSGGPVISLRRKNGRISYKLAGIQSSWLPESKIVRVERVENVIVLLGAVLDMLTSGGD